jgi:potassium efflux system protein
VKSPGLATSLRAAHIKLAAALGALAFACATLAQPSPPHRADDTAATLRAELERVRTEWSALGSAVAPEGDGEARDSLEARKRATARLVTLIGARLDAANTVGAAIEAPVALVPDGPPPHATAELDRLRDQLDTLGSQRAALRPLQASIDAELEAAIVQRRRTAETLRLRQEQFERTRPGADADRARSALRLAQIEARIADLEIAKTDEARSSVRARLDALAAPIDTLSRTIDAIRASQRIDDRDVDAIRASTETTRSRLAEERAAINDAIAALDGPEADTAQDAGRAARTLREALSALGELDAVEAARPDIWSQRRTALTARTDPEARRAAAATLERSLEQTRAHERAASERIRFLRTEERVQRTRTEALSAGSPEAPAARALAAALRRQGELHERTLDTLQRYDVLLSRTLSDISDTGAKGSASREADRAAGVGATLRAAADRVWNFELFSATETTVIEGRSVTVDYGVTVGKSLGALLLFLAGWWVASRISRRVIDLAVARGAASAALGRVLHRWMMTVLLIAVTLGVLKLARVPLTAFAFLGGAIAIGVGFGTQNLIKNLISGVIILFERKIRVGDIITIDGVSGTVSGVDLRATTVRGFDGIESILPNSRLLETTVADWSHGNRQIRNAIVVPVAVDEDTRVVADCLLECARAHPSVLDEPAPEALFDDIRPGCLVVRLQYWIKLGGARAGPTVASDLRFGIASMLRERGVAPARSLHEVHVAGGPDAAPERTHPSNG